MKTIAILLSLITSILTFGQDSQLSIFKNLVNKTWVAEGKWEDATKFNQEITLSYSLDSAIIIVNTIGFIDKEQTSLGIRNNGIRQFNKKTKKIKFWEFDIFGGLTEGIVFSDGNNIIYQYSYGDSTVTDMWEYVNDSTYNFKVGNYKDGAWKQLYLSTRFMEIKKE